MEIKNANANVDLENMDNRETKNKRTKLKSPNLG